jgi:hypothetical protein
MKAATQGRRVYHLISWSSPTRCALCGTRLDPSNRANRHVSYDNYISGQRPNWVPCTPNILRVDGFDGLRAVVVRAKHAVHIELARSRWQYVDRGTLGIATNGGTGLRILLPGICERWVVLANEIQNAAAWERVTPQPKGQHRDAFEACVMANEFGAAAKILIDGYLDARG